MFNTCDLLLCSGNGIASQVIQAVNKLNYIKDSIKAGTYAKDWLSQDFKDDLSLSLSHLALAINITEREHEANPQLWNHMPTAGRYVFESTTGNVKWSGVSGVQINPFDRWLDKYGGNVWIRNLMPIDEDRPHNIKAITDMVNMIGTPYESGIPGLLELGMTFNSEIRIDTPELHCTESGVIVNKMQGLFKPKTDAHKMPPCNFGDGREIEQLVTCEISPMRLVK